MTDGTVVIGVGVVLMLSGLGILFGARRTLWPSTGGKRRSGRAAERRRAGRAASAPVALPAAPVRAALTAGPAAAPLAAAPVAAPLAAAPVAAPFSAAPVAAPFSAAPVAAPVAAPRSPATFRAGAGGAEAPVEEALPVRAEVPEPVPADGSMSAPRPVAGTFAEGPVVADHPAADAWFPGGHPAAVRPISASPWNDDDTGFMPAFTTAYPGEPRIDWGSRTDPSPPTDPAPPTEVYAVPAPVIVPPWPPASPGLAPDDAAGPVQHAGDPQHSGHDVPVQPGPFQPAPFQPGPVPAGFQRPRTVPAVEVAAPTRTRGYHLVPAPASVPVYNPVAPPAPLVAEPAPRPGLPLRDAGAVTGGLPTPPEPPAYRPDDADAGAADLPPFGSAGLDRPPYPGPPVPPAPAAVAPEADRHLPSAVLPGPAAVPALKAEVPADRVPVSAADIDWTNPIDWTGAPAVDLATADVPPPDPVTADTRVPELQPDGSATAAAPVPLPRPPAPTPPHGTAHGTAPDHDHGVPDGPHHGAPDGPHDDGVPEDPHDDGGPLRGQTGFVGPMGERPEPDGGPRTRRRRSAASWRAGARAEAGGVVDPAVRRGGPRSEAVAVGDTATRLRVSHPRAEARRRVTAATELIPVVADMTALLPVTVDEPGGRGAAERDGARPRPRPAPGDWSTVYVSRHAAD